MGIVIIQAVFTILNTINAFRNYKSENYKAAIFCGFCSGFCFLGFIIQLFDC